MNQFIKSMTLKSETLTTPICIDMYIWLRKLHKLILVLTSI